MNKYALVTGCDHGLGYALVVKLITEGYIVFAGCYFNSFEHFQPYKEQYKDNLHLFCLDISDTQSVLKVKEYIATQTDYIDILINNAGILGDIEDTIEDQLDFDAIEQVIRVNAIGTLKVTNTLFPYLRNGNGKLILTISSEAGSIEDCNRESWFGYCMSKTAINMESALIQNKFYKYNGQVMVVHPGWMKTYMRGKLDENAEITPEYSAECIWKLIENRIMYKSEKPVYLDYKGNKLNW